MSSHEEVTYSQEEMDEVLAILRKSDKEAEQSKQLLWAVVDAVGGEVAIPYLAWLDNRPTKSLLMWDDQATLTLHLKIRNIDGEIDHETKDEVERLGGQD